MPNLSGDWTEHASCFGRAKRGSDPWYPINLNGQTYKQLGAFKAKSFCKRCPVREQCLNYALRIEEGLSEPARFGIWGGTTPAERVHMRRAGAA